MLTTTCDGCRRRIAEDDPRAARRLPLGGELVDWCGECIGIVKAELPRLAAEAREARTLGDRVREGVQHRARNLWGERDAARRRSREEIDGQLQASGYLPVRKA